ncbi:hypothetical protein [Undibacterium macrobrachii]|uniref:Alanine-rich protein n=1 Tax=Undibacterium macrobrachii TaxID=1119058 RepID=A0ABQ2XF85_9BURK|nr:hypothetical protein [Undibacterium macrobrachii]GGX13690.1 hypothetical protein GCM10011282_19770 [Undibacterium macrobrachii]
MAYRSLYTYAWDIADIGVSQFVDEMLGMGITDVTIATAYHAGKFIRPHAKHPPRVIFPEDGVGYFDPNLQAYGEIKPQAHSDQAMRAVLPALLQDGRLKVHAWTVLLHNTRLGTAFPQHTVKNAYGDPYVYSLCPMHTAVFDYAVNLCKDLSHQHALSSIVLETPGWQPYAHGYHHEFAQVASNPWLDNMLGMCFCDACTSAAKEKGIAIDALQTRVQANIHSYLALPADAQTDQAASWTQSDLLSDPELLAFISMRQDRVTQLVSAIRAAIPSECELAVIPTVQRPTAACWTEGSDLKALSEVADYLEIPFYEPSANRAIADAWESLRQIGNPEKIRAILRPGLPDLNQGADLAPAIKGIQALGIRDFAFYNYGLLPQYQLDHLANTLKEQN